MRTHVLRFSSYPAGVIVLVFGLLSASCSASDVDPLPDDTLALGTWGGDDAGVIVTESGIHVHVGCTYGDVAGAIPLDSDGRFAIDGSYVLRAYPVAVGPALPAQFAGQVRHETLTLAIAVNDTVEHKLIALGPVSVVFDREPRMAMCPICRVPGARAPKSRREILFWRL